MASNPQQPGPAGNGRLASLMKNGDLAFTFMLFGIVGLLVLPVPPMFMDLLLAANIAISLLILLVIVYVREPSEFSVFPSILLGTTLFRLGLNVASTRLILLDGYAGNVIDAFGSFVVRGNFIVGTVVFLILVIINFVVITKGAGRIAEVAARFTLDAMPGKQMSIDAELNAGVIDEVTAGRRREKIQTEADFYGAMDGASKFVRGDAMAGIIITLINVIGGISIGMAQNGMPMSEALERYTLLSIGDGLVSQIPALVISVAAGILVTRTSSTSDLGSHIGRQLMIYPRAISILGGMLLVFAILPGMPMLPFAVMGLLCFGISYTIKKLGLAESEELAQGRGSAGALPARSGSGGGGNAGGESGTGEASPAASPGNTRQDFEKLIGVDVFVLELGFGLLALADRQRGGDLLDRITGVRKSFAREMGIIVPSISVRDNLELDNNGYRFLLRGKEVARGSVYPNRWMAMNVAGSSVQLKGVPAVEPVFQLEAVWVPDDEKKNAEIHGFTVVDASSVLITHLSEVLRGNAADLLEREDAQKLIDLVKEKNPTLVGELLPDLVNVGLIQRVLQNLLRERVPVGNLSIILETIGDFAQFSKNPDDLAEQVRRRLGPYFVHDYETEPRILRAMTLEPRLEQALVSRVKRGQFEIGLLMDPQLTQHMLGELTPRLERMMEEGIPPLLICTSELRLAFKRFFDPSLPRLVVLAYQELPNELQIQSYAIIQAPQGMPMQERVPEAAATA